MNTACRHCGAAVGRWVDACPACGKATDQPLPWYGWLLGGALVLAIFLWLADFGGLIAFIGRLMRP